MRRTARVRNAFWKDYSKIITTIIECEEGRCNYWDSERPIGRKDAVKEEK